MKHIDIRAHFIRNQVNEGIIDVVRISGKENPADVLTKALTQDASQTSLGAKECSTKGLLLMSRRDDVVACML